MVWFDATNVAPKGEYTTLSPGEYPCVVVSIETKQNKANTGTYEEVTLEVIDGEYTGRKIFDRITRSNPNTQAVQIGASQLSALLHACGNLTPARPELLYNIPIIAVVAVRPGQGEYGPSNEVKTYKAKKASPRHSAPMPAPAPVGQRPNPFKS